MLTATPHQRSDHWLARAVALASWLAMLGLACSAAAQGRPREIPEMAASELIRQAEAMVTAGRQAEALKAIQEVTGPECQFDIGNTLLAQRLRLLSATLLARTGGKRGALKAIKLLSPDLERATVDRTLRFGLAEILSYFGDGRARAAALRLIQPIPGKKEAGDILWDPEQSLTLARLRKQELDLRGVQEALSACRRRAAEASACSEERLLIEATALASKEQAELLALLRQLPALPTAKARPSRRLPSKKKTGCVLICDDPDSPLCI